MNAPADEKNDSLAFISCYFLHPFFEIIDLICGDSVDFKQDVALHKSGKGSPTCGFDAVHQKTRLIFSSRAKTRSPKESSRTVNSKVSPHIGGVHWPVEGACPRSRSSPEESRREVH